MINRFTRFLEKEDGAITVDWVVLTAAMVGFGVAIVAMISASATDVSTGIGAYVEDQESLLE
ncbi:MAG: hypothetical protein AAFR35_00825 [Pseudomonadota bacterium]